MEPKDYKYNSDPPVFNEVEGNPICKDCIHRLPDYKGSVVVYGYAKGICKAFPNDKPIDIAMNRSSKCPKREVE